MINLRPFTTFKRKLFVFSSKCKWSSETIKHETIATRRVIPEKEFNRLHWSPVWLSSHCFSFALQFHARIDNYMAMIGTNGGATCTFVYFSGWQYEGTRCETQSQRICCCNWTPSPRSLSREKFDLEMQKVRRILGTYVGFKWPRSCCSHVFLE